MNKESQLFPYKHAFCNKSIFFIGVKTYAILIIIQKIVEWTIISIPNSSYFGIEWWHYALIYKIYYVITLWPISQNFLDPGLRKHLSKKKLGFKNTD